MIKRLFCFASLFFVCVIASSCSPAPVADPVFNAERALEDIQMQLSFGARYPGSDGHQRVRAFMEETLRDSRWETSWNVDPTTEPVIYNLQATRGTDERFWLLLGTHYDTREFADEEPDAADRLKPVPGANDGASGTAVLLELARILPDDLPCRLSLVFFDAEDQGRIAGRDWSEGATFFVKSLEQLPDEVVIIDMIGDQDLNIYRELNSDINLNDRLWMIAASLGYEQFFIDQSGYSIIDDHLPFVLREVPTALLIDFDYPYWHTLDDTLEQVSTQSLDVVGSTLLKFILQHPQCGIKPASP